MELGHTIGLIGQEQITQLRHKRDLMEQEVGRLKQTHLSGSALSSVLARPGFRYADLPQAQRRDDLPLQVIDQVEIECKYEGYISRNHVQAARMQKMERRKIPAQLQFETIPALRREASERFGHIQPATLGQASRIPGITPCDVAQLVVYLDGLERSTAR
tara:strand:+ start:56 stop:535 length:480 start_codon:yes stop_codon:yes gene_type:complete